MGIVVVDCFTPLVDIPKAYYEGTDGSASRSYNKNIFEGTLKFAMIDLLQHPPKELEGAINAHFR